MDPPDPPPRKYFHQLGFLSKILNNDQEDTKSNCLPLVQSVNLRCQVCRSASNQYENNRTFLDCNQSWRKITLDMSYCCEDLSSTVVLPVESQHGCAVELDCKCARLLRCESPKALDDKSGKKMSSDPCLADEQRISRYKNIIDVEINNNTNKLNQYDCSLKSESICRNSSLPSFNNLKAKLKNLELKLGSCQDFDQRCDIRNAIRQTRSEIREGKFVADDQLEFSLKLDEDVTEEDVISSNQMTMENEQMNMELKDNNKKLSQDSCIPGIGSSSSYDNNSSSSRSSSGSNDDSGSSCSRGSINSANRITTSSSSSASDSMRNGEDKTPPVFETLPQDLVVTEGEDACFECRISSGVESIHWYKDDDSIPSDDEEFKQSFDGRLAQLSISETYLDDAALYRCMARNTAGESCCTVRLSVNEESSSSSSDSEEETKTTSEDGPPVFIQEELSSESASVDGPPVFIQEELSSKSASVDGPPVFIRELSNVMNGTVGSPVVLQCSISSQSNPLLVTWYKDSQRLPPGSHFQQTCNGNTEQLVISKTNQTDSGQYECEASNKFGKVSSAYRLTLKEEFLDEAKSEEDVISSERGLLDTQQQAIDVVKETTEIHQTDDEGRLNQMLNQTVNTELRKEIRARLCFIRDRKLEKFEEQHREHKREEDPVQKRLRLAEEEKQRKLDEFQRKAKEMLLLKVAKAELKSEKQPQKSFGLARSFSTTEAETRQVNKKKESLDSSDRPSVGACGMSGHQATEHHFKPHPAVGSPNRGNLWNILCGGSERKGPPSSPSKNCTNRAANLERSATTIKQRLLDWCKSMVKEYENVEITNFSSSWNDGMAFCALIHHFYPNSFDYKKLDPRNRDYNFQLAFDTAEQCAGIAPLLEVEDMVRMKNPDWKCVFTYVQSIYRHFVLPQPRRLPQLNTQDD